MLEYNKIPEGLSSVDELLAKLTGKSETALLVEAGKRLERLQEIAAKIYRFQS